MRRQCASTTVSLNAPASSSTARTFCRVSSARRRKHERDRSEAFPIPSVSNRRIRGRTASRGGSRFLIGTGSRITLRTRIVMLFMVIERFRDNDMIPIYQRLRDSGRALPDGLEYVDSWVEPNFGRCFQLMRCDDMRLLQKWVLQWRGSGATFEIIPVVPSTETREVVAPYLEAPSENSS